MFSTNKPLLAGLFAALLASPLLAQTSSQTGAQTSSARQGTTAATSTAAQQLNSAMMNRLYGGLNATALTGQLPTAPGVGLVGGTVPGTTGTTTQQAIGTTSNTNNPATGPLPSQAGAFQPGTGYTNGISAARPGIITQGTGPAGITSAQQANNALLNQAGLNNNGARNAAAGTASAPATGSFNMGTGVPGTGISTPGTITQGSGYLPSESAPPQFGPGQFNRVYSGLSTSQMPGTLVPGAAGAVQPGQGTNGVQGISPTTAGMNPGLRSGLRQTTPPGGLRQTAPGGR